jgi:hypothetical protein
MSNGERGVEQVRVRTNANTGLNVKKRRRRE